MIELAFEYRIRQFIQIDLLRQYSSIHFYELKTDSKQYHVLSGEIGLS